ncbi:unnamed protein product [Plutella xylostella]|uniref:(diamondback moth) hypothetical protein n=1 Tax=Plutella xylostella TaxID=51655 RepID=A0A8S4FC50_PLUXY|nr:unnamed protein product [Plutella xylostella]
MLISETHLNDHKEFNLDGYNIYVSNHPKGTSQGGSAVLIRSSIKHHLHSTFQEEYIQATTVTVEGRSGAINVSAVYCPPKHTVSEGMWACYFKSLGPRFISGGDWNSKHTFWGSRLITTRGRELKRCLDSCKLTSLSTGEPTYWPTDPNKIPDLLDFFIKKGLSDLYCDVESCLDTISDHSLVIGTFSTNIIYREPPLTLYNHKTDWDAFAEYLNEGVDLKVRLKTEEDIDEATFYITNKIQEAAWRSTPEIKFSAKPVNIPFEIRRKIGEKRKLRRQWQLSRSSQDKTNLNRAARELKEIIEENQNATFKDKLSQLSATKKDNYSLWKITKNLKRPQQPIPPIRTPQGTWAKTPQEKVDVFAEHLSQVFTPNSSNMMEFENEIDQVINSDQQLSPPIKLVTPNELHRTIMKLSNKKAPGFDLITGEILKHLPRKPVVFLTMLFNAVLRIQYYPKLWKVSQICMTPKDGKPPTDPGSYRPISLLPLLSKLFEKVFLRRLKPILDEEKLIPDHQFGFREEHSTVEQIHRIVEKIRLSLEKKEYCSAAFLDIQQAFDRVWHKGLLFKMKNLVPNSFFMVLKSYLHGRKFQVKIGETTSKLYEIQASVPQGSVLGPVLYSIYTADLPCKDDDVVMATYADDTACLSSNKDPILASQKLQAQLDEIDVWLQKWRIKSSATKSVHVTFTLRKGDCPPVNLGSEQLPHKNCVKYLGLRLDRRLTWAEHIKAKKTEANLQYQKLNWLIGRQSPLSLNNKLLVYKCTIKPIWTYGIQLWGSASNSNLEILQRFQNKVLRDISGATWYTRNAEIHEYLGMPTVKEEICSYSSKYQDRLQGHTNKLARDLLMSDPEDTRRLKRWHILSLSDRI